MIYVIITYTCIHHYNDYSSDVRILNDDISRSYNLIFNIMYV